MRRGWRWCSEERVPGAEARTYLRGEISQRPEPLAGLEFDLSERGTSVWPWSLAHSPAKCAYGRGTWDVVRVGVAVDL